MPYETLVDPSDLREHLADPAWAIVDCRFSLDDPDRGRRAYREAHIPGAVYAHLDDDLSGPAAPGRTGRHPLPPADVMAARLSRWGIGDGVQVVAYDGTAGAIAARLWWMLRWLGHDAVAVLDGGFDAWREAAFPVRGGTEKRPQRRFTPRPRPGLAVDAAAVDRMRGDAACRVLDARAAPRYRGEEEPIDPVAGHIPGAVSAPHAGNVDERGRFLSPEALRRRYARLVGGASPDCVVAYCGSGVTAAHDVLAMVHAGLGQPLLYPGSWSEWITDPERPVAREA